MKILIITKYFPPVNTIASHRLYSFAKYLPQYGIDVEIVTPQWQGNLDLHIGDMIVHHTHRETEKLQFRKSNHAWKNILKQSGVRALRHYLNSPFYKAGKALPDSIFKKQHAILASYGPEDALHLASHLCRKHNLSLIVDYRDLWLDNPFQDWTAMDRAIIYRLEKQILQQSALVCTVSQTLSKQLFERYRQKARVIYNGFWELPENVPSAEKKNGVSFCYCGSLYDGLRPIHITFPFLAKYSQHNLVAAVFDDVDVAYLKRMVEKYKLSGQVKILQNIPHKQAVELEKHSDILLFLNSLDRKSKGVLTGKLFEYMQSGKFILGVGNPDDEAAKIIKDVHLGTYISKENQMSTALAAFQAWSPPPAEKLAFFSRKHQAERLATFIKESLDHSV